jgi:flagellar biosynthesis chaperone FliJ
MTTLSYDELHAAYQHVVDSREKAIKEIMRLERERDELRGQLTHAAGVIKDLQDKMLPVNEYVARLEAACKEALLYFDMLSDPDEQADDMMISVQRIDAERAIREALPKGV